MRIGLFYDDNLPYAGVRPDASLLDELLQDMVLINSQNYQTKLQEEYDCLINLHGCYFIKPAWKAIKKHLQQGKGLVNLGGGVPFSIPVSEKEGRWVPERVQTAYHEELQICSALTVEKDRFEKYAINPDLPLLEGFEACFTLRDTIGLIVQFTHAEDWPKDEGSSGPMDAVLYPLLTASMVNGRKTAAPVVMIENTKGVYDGGRWIFVNHSMENAFWVKDGVNLIRKLSDYAARGAYEILLRPNYASYYPGESPTLLFQGQALGGGKKKARIDIRITRGEEVFFQDEFNISLSEEILYHSFPLGKPVVQGMYLMETRVEVEGEPVRILRNGFWGYDRELMESGEHIRCGRDYFYKDGKPMPIVGMTYMQSDVHRKFIYLPNVHLWNQDFAEMKNAGINMVRTGIWTAHRTAMFNDGITSEEILRALDAMFLTAKHYDIPIVFNFFAFAPELWEGINPYLDPRSVKAQKRFINSIVSRHINSKGVSWDLINEPSVCNPVHLWRPAPNRDPYELAEWRKWLRCRHESIEELQERWNCSSADLPSFDSVMLPDERDFNNRKDNPMPMNGLKIHDYILFTQYVMNLWAGEMIKAIRAVGSEQLVTIGQDEALSAKRPSPFFYQQEVAYTTNHSWWLLDDLYWDGIFAKTPDKPNLIQETGMMYTQNADRKPRRNEAELRNILERKYALAFAANNAGAIQWIWNINIYMNNLNEANIGAVRADGTQKREADVSYDFGHFMSAVAYLLEGRKEEEVAVIYPYANDFSVRDYAPASTKTLSRILGYDMNVPFKAYGEYQLESLGSDKLIMLPSPRTLTQQAWEVVMDRVEKGSVLLITGPFSYDEYWSRVENRAQELKLDTVLENIHREEALYIDGKPYRASFGYNKIAWIDKEVELSSGPIQLKTLSHGQGKVVWCPLPIEMNEERETIQAVYRQALDTAGVRETFRWLEGNEPGILGKRLEFDEGSLYVFVSESAEDAQVSIRDEHSGYRFTLPADRVMLFATDKQGQVIKAYRDWSIERF